MKNGANLEEDKEEYDKLISKVQRRNLNRMNTKELIKLYKSGYETDQITSILFNRRVNLLKYPSMFINTLSLRNIQYFQFHYKNLSFIAMMLCLIPLFILVFLEPNGALYDFMERINFIPSWLFNVLFGCLVTSLSIYLFLYFPIFLYERHILNILNARAGEFLRLRQEFQEDLNLALEKDGSV